MVRGLEYWKEAQPGDEVWVPLAHRVTWLVGPDPLDPGRRTVVRYADGTCASWPAADVGPAG